MAQKTNPDNRLPYQTEGKTMGGGVAGVAKNLLTACAGWLTVCRNSYKAFHVPFHFPRTFFFV